MHSYRDLDVWQKANRLALEVYKLTLTFPVEERYGLVSQLRRAALSVPTNLVEGSKRKSSADFAHFINMSEGSVAEVEYLLSFSKDLGYATEESVAPMVRAAIDVGRMLYSLRAKVEQR